MSQEGDGGGGQGGFPWENPQWAFSNSDNSGSGRNDPKTGTRPVESTTNSPTNQKDPGERKRNRPGPSKSSSSKGVGGVGDSDHELHIWTERERRKKMRNMFSNLHALLPQLPPKV